jgi:hypothetical protein
VQRRVHAHVPLAAVPVQRLVQRGAERQQRGRFGGHQHDVVAIARTVVTISISPPSQRSALLSQGWPPPVG